MSMFRVLRLLRIPVPTHFAIPFLRYPWAGPMLIAGMMACALAGLWTRGISWGVDFRGGTVIEAQLSKPVDLNTVRKQLHQATGKEISLQELGGKGTTILVRTEHLDNPSSLIDSMRKTIDPDIQIRKTESIGPRVGQELIRSGLQAIAWALVGIMAYVWIRFEWQFSLCALIALLHDCLGLLAFFMWGRLDFNEGAVVAILITAAYSVNDTVVIFDRLRENRTRYQGLTFSQLLEKSLNETMRRTLLTSSTAVLALSMMYVFGGDVVSAFSLPILVGIIVGAYSSVAIAVPMMAWLPEPKMKGKMPGSTLASSGLGLTQPAGKSPGVSSPSQSAPPAL
jgi:preprotein translocase subunit SecF